MRRPRRDAEGRAQRQQTATTNPDAERRKEGQGGNAKGETRRTTRAQREKRPQGAIRFPGERKEGSMARRAEATQKEFGAPYAPSDALVAWWAIGRQRSLKRAGIVDYINAKSKVSQYPNFERRGHVTNCSATVNSRTCQKHLARCKCPDTCRKR